MWRETLATIWGAKMASALICIVAGAMCLVPLLTVGRSAAAAAGIAERMEQAGSRRIQVIDAKQAGFINQRTVSQIAALSTAEQVAALGQPFDVVNGVVRGTLTPTWPVITDLNQIATLHQGRWPRPGEAVVARAALARLNFATPLGFVTSGDDLKRLAIVGSYDPAPGFEDLVGVLTPAAEGETGRELRVLVDSTTTAKPTVQAVMAILNPSDPDGVHLTSPVGLADVARDMNRQMASYGRSMLLATLGAGGFFIAMVVLADALIRRKDLGRRRTLGANRWDLTALVALRATLVALIGALAGTLLGLVMTWRDGVHVPLPFAAALITLAFLTAGIASIGPATYAARRDPVTIMRTP